MKNTTFKKKLLFIGLRLWILLLFISAGPAVFAALLYDPSLHWKTVQTEHFYIHYHQGLEETALSMKIIAEDVHSRLAPRIRWKPWERTHVILIDNLDDANGMAMPFPVNRVEIYVSRPSLNSSLNNFTNWLEMVFTHEYTHILTLDMIRGCPAVTRYFPGRIWFPGSFQPLWLIEGNAVFHESRETGRGRNNSTYTDMVLRTEVNAGTLKSISQASHFPRSWPMGQVPYLYGGLFTQYLNRTYTEDSVDEVYRENADNVIPYLINKNARDVYGRSFIDLYRDWEQSVKNGYRKQIESIRAAGLSRYKILSHTDNSATLPRFSRTSRALYFIRKSRTRGNSLVRYDFTSGDSRNLCRVFFPDSMSVTGSDDIVISDKQYYRNFSLYNEAYRFRGAYNAVTSRLRGKYIDMTDDGNAAIYIAQNNGRFDLVETDPSFKAKKMLIADTDIQLSFARLSPDGREIVFTIKDRGGYTDLAIMNRITGKCTRITRDAYNDIDPAWHPAGDRIIFSSDRNGVYNLHEYDRNKETVTRLTNVIGGAFSPDISTDGTIIAFASYEKNGYAISIMPYPGSALKGEQAALFDSPETVPAPAYESGKQKTEALDAGFFTSRREETRDLAGSKSYNAFNSVLPQVVLPQLYSKEIYEGTMDYALGFYTLGNDVLYRHSYFISMFYFFKQKQLNLDLSYTFSALYPDFTVGYSDDSIFTGKDDFPWEGEHNTLLYRELNRSGYISVLFPFVAISRIQAVNLAYIYEKSFIDTNNTASRYFPHYEIMQARIQGAWLFDNTRSHVYSISPEQGRKLLIIADIFNRALASDYSYYRAAGNYSEFLPGFMDNHVTKVRLRGGIYINKPDMVNSFSLGQYTRGETGDPEDIRDEWGLRGYPAGRFYGDRLMAATLEYRFPLIQFDAAYNTFPVMFRDLWLTCFADYGTVWNGALSVGDLKPSAGVELHTRITLGYAVDLKAFIGYARGFSPEGENQVYFAVGTIFAGSLKNSGKRLDYFQ